ncbi:hypothetical protein Gasu2_02480 [Galdieria sulphuraria]|nr:hypothetical protein Gasu2_02480 [Galdieria sulphuraria]
MKNNSKVQVLDFDSYSSVVYSSDKDVVLFIFTTWCGHCLDFIPQYMELASNLSYIEDLTFAAIQPRDMPPIARKLDISSFPVFYLFLRGQKDSPIRNKSLMISRIQNSQLYVYQNEKPFGYIVSQTITRYKKA